MAPDSDICQVGFPETVAGDVREVFYGDIEMQDY